MTGASSGIGRAAALRLAGAGATVLAHGRSAQKLGDLARALGTDPLLADFSRLCEVRRLADHVRRRTGRLDAILHNAGSFHKRRVLTEDGHESTFQTNYLAPFLLQSLLHDLVLWTPGARVVVTSSVASRIGRVDLDDLSYARRGYRGFRAYADTKLMNILFAGELRRRLAAAAMGGPAAAPAPAAGAAPAPHPAPVLGPAPDSAVAPDPAPAALPTAMDPAPAAAPPTAVAVHPGAVASSFGRGSLLPRFLYRVPIRKELLIGYFVHTPEEGAEPLVWHAAGSDGARQASCVYFSRFRCVTVPSPQGDDPELARALWERSEKMVERWMAP